MQRSTCIVPSIDVERHRHPSTFLCVGFMMLLRAGEMSHCNLMNQLANLILKAPVLKHPTSQSGELLFAEKWRPSYFQTRDGECSVHAPPPTILFVLACFSHEGRSNSIQCLRKNMTNVAALGAMGACVLPAPQFDRRCIVATSERAWSDSMVATKRMLEDEDFSCGR